MTAIDLSYHVLRPRTPASRVVAIFGSNNGWVSEGGIHTEWLDDRELWQALRARDADTDLIRALAIRAFRRHTGSTREEGAPIESDEQEKFSAWIRELVARGGLDLLAFGLGGEVPQWRVALFPEMSTKLTAVGQRHCRICVPAVDGPFGLHLPLLLPPRSFRGLERGFMDALRRALTDRLPTGWSSAYFHERLCMTVTFVIGPGRRSIDVDNMAKVLLDGLNGVLYADDSQVDHLDVAKVVLRHPFDEFVLVGVQRTRLNEHIDVIDPTLRLGFAGAKPIDVASYMTVVPDESE